MDDSEGKKRLKRNGILIILKNIVFFFDKKWGWSFHPFNWFCKIFKFLIWDGRSSRFSIRPLGSLEIKEESISNERKDSEEISKINKTIKSHMIVAALIGTVTFATGFTLPGDCIQDKGNNQGMAVLSFPTNGTMDHNGLMATTVRQNFKAFVF